MTSFFETGLYDVIVIGAGHAGCEAAIAAAKLGKKVLCLTMNLDSVALMACNPSIGGTSKGHLVREVDALGGMMGKVADEATIQNKMLNTGKGPAVHSLRAQADKRIYHEKMKSYIENQQNLEVFQAEVDKILTNKKFQVTGVTTKMGATYYSKSIVVATGVYLNSLVMVGDKVFRSGPSGMFSSELLSKSLEELGFYLRRFKTGTPSRVNKNSLDLEKMQEQHGDVDPTRFSFWKTRINILEKENVEQQLCYLTYTNENTHQIIRENLEKSAMYSGNVKGTGARYCPSIEDKVFRFADRERHQLFIEPEGLSTNEMYVQGLSTSMPENVQQKIVNSIKGMENAKIMRSAYAIEYDCIDATQLELSLQSKSVKGLFFAGQINGTSGYEEAAAQGLVAGINAAKHVSGEAPMILDRSQAYIGVLIDDLVTKGTNEPYRMMTSRAEYRLMLRQDNADLRLCEIGYSVGLVSKKKYETFCNKKAIITEQINRLKTQRPDHKKMIEMFDTLNESAPTSGVTLFDLLKRETISYDLLKSCDLNWLELDKLVVEQIQINAKYEGYIIKQEAEILNFKRLESKKLNSQIDYNEIKSLRIEARQKLSFQKPENLGQASRISGVSPADISVLRIYIEKIERLK